MLRLPQCAKGVLGGVQTRGSLVLTRGARMKGRSKVISEEEEDSLLQQLEIQYKRAKARLAQEDEAKKADLLHQSLKPDPPPAAVPRPLESHNLSLWDQLVSKEDQVKLAVHGIKSLEELRNAYQEAEADLNRPPYPSVQRLRPRLRLAHELYKSIPRKLALRQSKRSN